jgi:hypothetical protein
MLLAIGVGFFEEGVLSRNYHDHSLPRYQCQETQTHTYGDQHRRYYSLHQYLFAIYLYA